MRTILPALLLCAVGLTTGASATTVSVSGNVGATANIWSAGHDQPMSLVGGAGSLAFLLSLPDNHGGVLSFSSITGMVDYGGCCAPNDADGIEAAVGGGVGYSFESIAGVDVPRARFFAGVFIGDDEPAGDAPPVLQMDSIDFDSLAPGLGQSFFIGDGLDADGNTQTFIIPPNATRLFLGFHDGFNGVPGFFQDNTGSVDFTAQIAVVPVPAGIWLLGSALLGLGQIRGRSQC